MAQSGNTDNDSTFKNDENFVENVENEIQTRKFKDIIKEFEDKAKPQAFIAPKPKKVWTRYNHQQSKTSEEIEKNTKKFHVRIPYDPKEKAKRVEEYRKVYRPPTPINEHQLDDGVDDEMIKEDLVNKSLKKDSINEMKNFQNKEIIPDFRDIKLRSILKNPFNNKPDDLVRCMFEPIRDEGQKNTFNKSRNMSECKDDLKPEILENEQDKSSEYQGEAVCNESTVKKPNALKFDKQYFVPLLKKVSVNNHTSIINKSSLDDEEIESVQRDFMFSSNNESGRHHDDCQMSGTEPTLKQKLQILSEQLSVSSLNLQPNDDASKSDNEGISDCHRIPERSYQKLSDKSSETFVSSSFGNRKDSILTQLKPQSRSSSKELNLHKSRSSESGSVHSFKKMSDDESNEQVFYKK